MDVEVSGVAVEVNVSIADAGELSGIVGTTMRTGILFQAQLEARSNEQFRANEVRADENRWTVQGAVGNFVVVFDGVCVSNRLSGNNRSGTRSSMGGRKFARWRSRVYRPVAD